MKIMKNLIFLTLFLFCCLFAHGQDYLKLANACFEKGDYECAVKNYNFIKEFDSSKDVSAQFQKADKCFRTLIVADEYFNEKEYAKARDRYKTVLGINPKDPNAKKQYDLCMAQLNRPTPATHVTPVAPATHVTPVTPVAPVAPATHVTPATPATPATHVTPAAPAHHVSPTNIRHHLGEPEMVFVQGGTFAMGCTPDQGGECYDDERPAYKVTLSSYYIGKSEVTQAQWEAVMGDNPSHFKGHNLPVESVSWNDIQEFIRKLNAQTGKQYRLPTEAEWEYAARGGNKSQGYKYSGNSNLNNVAWYKDNSGSTTHPVGIKSSNELGIYDMSGNVCEWCSDWYGAVYNHHTPTNPQGPSTGTGRVLRGGSWFDIARCRSAYRYYNAPDNRISNNGFRLACSSE